MKDLTRGKLYKTFLLYAIPMVLSGLLSVAHGTIDTVIAGKFLGDDGLAAVGCTSAFLSFASALFWGFGSAASIFTASLFGAKDYVAIKSSIYHFLSVVIAASVLFSVIVIAFSDPILNFLQVDPTIYMDAKLYLCIYLVGFSMILLNNTFVHTMNALGLSSYPLYMSVLSAVLNISGNIFAITVLKLGVAGVAAATVLSAFVVDVFYVLKLRSCFREINVLKTKVHFDKKMLAKISIFSMPSAFQQAIMYTASVLISPIINAIGSSASASYAVVLKIYDFSAQTYYASSKTVSSYTAQCIGAGKDFGYIKKGVRIGLMQSLIFASVPILICVCFAKPICGIFFPAGSGGESLAYSILFSRYFLPFVLFNAVNNLFHAFYRATGTGRLLMLLTAVGAVSRLIFTILLASRGMTGVFIGWALSWIFEAVLAIASYFSGMWKKDVLARRQ